MTIGFVLWLIPVSGPLFRIPTFPSVQGEAASGRWASGEGCFSAGKYGLGDMNSQGGSVDSGLIANPDHNSLQRQEKKPPTQRKAKGLACLSHQQG